MTKPNSSIKAGNAGTRIAVEGPGTRVWAYRIDAETYARLARNDNDDDPMELVKRGAKGDFLVCWGLDVSSAPPLTLAGVGDHPLPIVKTWEGYGPAEACADSGIDPGAPFIEYDAERRIYLGDDVDLRGVDHVVLECLPCGRIALSLDLPIPLQEVDREKLFLLARDMDSGTELCELAYRQDLLNGTEEDIVGVIYDGVSHFFRGDLGSPGRADYWLLSRSPDGWAVNHDVLLVRARQVGIQLVIRSRDGHGGQD